MICIPKLALEIQDLSLPATVLLPRLDDKMKFQPTVTLSTTEAKFMAACNFGWMSLFVHSILWDLDIPQEAAMIAYKDNNRSTAMGNA
jgi:hypothetical protein